MLFLLLGSFAIWWCWFLVGRTFMAAGHQELPERETFEWHVLVGGLVLAVLTQAVHFLLPLPSKTSAIVLATVFTILAAARWRDTLWLAAGLRHAIERRPGAAAAY